MTLVKSLVGGLTHSGASFPIYTSEQWSAKIRYDYCLGVVSQNSKIGLTMLCYVIASWVWWYWRVPKVVMSVNVGQDDGVVRLKEISNVGLIVGWIGAASLYRWRRRCPARKSRLATKSSRPSRKRRRWPRKRRWRAGKCRESGKSPAKSKRTTNVLYKQLFHDFQTLWIFEVSHLPLLAPTLGYPPLVNLAAVNF